MAYNRQDAWYKRAKKEGYRSRAAYKLQELDQRFKVLQRGMRVVDLGCAPGGWLQVAAARVGPGGRVVGVDRLPVEPLEMKQVHILQGDLTDPGIRQTLQDTLGGPADLVLSDMAPDTSGVGFADGVRSAELVRLAAAVAHDLLRPNGSMLAKVFEGAELVQLVPDLKKTFSRIKRVRPDTTRKGSREIYLLCTGHKDRIG